MMSNAAVVCRRLLHIVVVSEPHNRDALSPLHECMHATCPCMHATCTYAKDYMVVSQTRRQRDVRNQTAMVYLQGVRGGVLSAEKNATHNRFASIL